MLMQGSSVGKNLAAARTLQDMKRFYMILQRGSRMEDLSAAHIADVLVDIHVRFECVCSDE